MKSPKWLVNLRKKVVKDCQLPTVPECEPAEEDGKRSANKAAHLGGEEASRPPVGYSPPAVIICRRLLNNNYVAVPPFYELTQDNPTGVNPELHVPLQGELSQINPTGVNSEPVTLPQENQTLSNPTGVTSESITSPGTTSDTNEVVCEVTPVRRGIRRTPSVSVRPKAMYGAIVILCIAMILPIGMVRSLDGPELFDKHQKMNKLILKNQIGYHFKKVVREVSQELFVSRRIDISTLLSGVHALKQTSNEVSSYCRSLGDGVITTKGNIQELSDYTWIKFPASASFAEAKARCEARKMQLPEMYTLLQHEHLASFLRANGLRRIFAGLQPDYADATFRFISTGFPIWRTPHTVVNNVQGGTIGIDSVMDDFNAKFFYDDGRKLLVRLLHNSVVSNPKFKLGSNTFRDSVKDFTQAVAPIVCQSKWEGLSYDHFAANSRTAHGLNIDSVVVKRSVSSAKPAEAPASTSLRELCTSIASEASDLHEDMSTKLKDLLSLVDITAQMEKDDTSRSKRDNNDKVESPSNDISLHHSRQKRFSFLSKFIFKTGVKLIWNLFGFIEKMRLERRLYKMDKSIAENKRLSLENQENIQNMSLIVSSNSIAIDQLRVTTSALIQRMNALESKVLTLTATVLGIANHMEEMLRLSYIANLVSRIKQSMDSGYETLKDVIHYSLLGQTSPSLLPTDQLKLVQAEVSKISTGILDTDFARMQSIVVSDPTDPHLLLVVINIAALSRKEAELVKLIPVPQFEGEKAYLPALDYDTIIIDQLSRTYSILNNQEEYDCLFNRCYVSDVERTIDQKTCGIPQLFDQQLNTCVFEETISTGVYVQPMLPDGILFALKEEVSTQLFCKDNSEIGTIKRLNGSGIMQLPNGCMLSVTDRHGKNTKVKGQPLYRLIDAEDMTLIMNGPLKSVHSYDSRNGSQKRVTPDGLITSHLDPVIQQVHSVDLKLETQTNYVYGVMGAIALTMIIIIVILMLMYRYSKKHFSKIYDLRDRLAELARYIHTLADFKNRLSQRLNPPILSAVKKKAKAAIFRSPLRAKRALDHLHERAHRLRHDVRPNVTHQEDDAHASCDDAPTYISMCDVSEMEPPVHLSGNRTYASFHSLTHESNAHRVPYPSLSSPFLHNNEELDAESEEVEALCKKFPTRSSDQED